MNKKSIVIVLIVILFVVPLAVLSYSLTYKTPQDTKFSISEGDGTREIAKNLKSAKLVRSETLFYFYVYWKHWYLLPGTYEIKKGTSLVDLAQLFRGGKVDEDTVTIPEGWRVTQIDEKLAEKGLIKKGEFIKIAASDEGYLFPDTYRFDDKATAQSIRQEMLDNFKLKTNDLAVTRDVLILASIVEREAKLDEDRAKIAGVYLNRLEIDMKLDADPTIQYGKGNWEPITASDYKNFQSPYNTYLNKGLPPGPICNPGLKSIQAVISPEKNGFYYFFHTTDGSAIFSETFEKHKLKLNSLIDL